MKIPFPSKDQRPNLQEGRGTFILGDEVADVKALYIDHGADRAEADNKRRFRCLLID